MMEGFKMENFLTLYVDIFFFNFETGIKKSEENIIHKQPHCNSSNKLCLLKQINDTLKSSQCTMY